jgi:uncharacterized membrane protein YbhN (UPF0104 family)
MNTKVNIKPCKILIDSLIKSPKKWIVGLGKILVFVGILWALQQKFAEKQQGIADLLGALSQTWTLNNVLAFVAVFVLMLVNWGLEARKWQLLAQKIEPMSFWAAYQSVLLGLSLSFITPANMGDIAGRIWKLTHKNRSASIGAILLGNALQFYVSLVLGCVALWRLVAQFHLWNNLEGIVLGCCGLFFMVLLGLYVSRNTLSQFLSHARWYSYLQQYFYIIATYSWSEIISTQWIAFLRYLTFSVQFVVVLKICHVDLPLLDLLTVVSLVFLSKTIIPAFNFISDLGIREFSAVYFFTYYHVNVSAVVSATLSLWLINILLPVVVGGVFVFTIAKK